MSEYAKTTAQILEELTDSVVTLDEKRSVESAEKALDTGVDAYTAITEGLARGMGIMGERYEKGICFVPELLLASDAMYAGMNVLKPHLGGNGDSDTLIKHRGVIGVIEGDTHDIGKNLVKIMFEANGFQMTDLGRDVAAHDFVETAVSENVEIICISTLMTTAMNGMKEVISLLEKEEFRTRFKVMIGGACISPVFAKRIGADGYAPTADSAVKLGIELLKNIPVRGLPENPND